jgi:hypothetical protein
VKASDVVLQLALRLPQLTPLLTREVPVASVSRAGTLLTVACVAPHGLQPGDGVSLVGAVTVITVSSFTRSGTVGTITTATDHDLTFNPNANQKTALPKTVTISGAVEAQFDGTFEIVGVDNRRVIRVVMANAGPTLATGAPILQGAESALRDYNTAYSVMSTPTPSTFTVNHPATTLANPIGSIIARAKARVAQAVEVERAIRAYTEQKVNELWLFVSLDDAFASKDRDISSDAVSNVTAHQYFRQQVIQPFSLYLFVPVETSLTGQSGRDVAEDLFRPICRSVLMQPFPSGLAAGSQGRTQFLSHGRFAYDSAVYVHAYSFQAVNDLSFADTVGPDLDVAFRDIALTLFPNLPGGGTGLANLTANFSLDTVPL